MTALLLLTRAPGTRSAVEFYTDEADDDGLLDGEELGTGSFGAQQVIPSLADAT